MVIDADGNLIFPIDKKVRQVKLEGGIAVFPLACNGAVDIDGCVHVDAVEADRSADSFFFLIKKVFPIPAG